MAIPSKELWFDRLVGKFTRREDMEFAGNLQTHMVKLDNNRALAKMLILVSINTPVLRTYGQDVFSVFGEMIRGWNGAQ